MSNDEIVDVGYVRAIAESSKAVLVELNGNEEWMPRSQMCGKDAGNEIEKEGDVGKLVVTKWIFNKKGLEKSSAKLEDLSPWAATKVQKPEDFDPEQLDGSSSAGGTVPRTASDGRNFCFFRFCSTSLNFETNDDNVIVQIALSADEVDRLAEEFAATGQDPHIRNFISFMAHKKVEFNVLEVIPVYLGETAVRREPRSKPTNEKTKIDIETDDGDW